jgi:dTDP-4-amino-4,6-dideoxygalactose transaminase
MRSSIKGSTGPIRELEDAWKEFLNNSVKHAITFNSGTSALLAAYFSLGIGEGDEVIAPAITYHAAVSCLYFLKAKPILVDVKFSDWTIDPEKIKEKITPKTKAITVVHQWGHPAAMDEILQIAKEHNLKVIEDCSHAHGSAFNGQQVGTFGDVAVFSLQANKIVFAGEGGILVTNSDEVHDRATLLGHYRDRSRDEILNPFYQQFWVTGYGLKLRMSVFNAVTALHALQALPQRIQERHKCLSYFRKGLSDLAELVLPPDSDDKNYLGAWYGFKPRYLSEKLHEISRDRYIEALVAEGVEVSEPGSPAFSSLPLFTVEHDKMFTFSRNKVVYKPGNFPLAEQLADEGLSLPTFTNWESDKKIIDQYIEAFHKVHRLAKGNL